MYDVFDSNQTYNVYQCLHRELLIYWYDNTLITFSIVLIWAIIPMIFFLCCHLLCVHKTEIDRGLAQTSTAITCMFYFWTFILIVGMIIVLGMWIVMGIPTLNDVNGSDDLAPQIVWSVMFWGCIYSIGAQLIVFVCEWIVYTGKHYEPQTNMCTSLLRLCRR